MTVFHPSKSLDPYFFLLLIILANLTTFANLLPQRNMENDIGERIRRRPFSVNKTLEMLFQAKSKRDGNSKPIFNEGR